MVAPNKCGSSVYNLFHVTLVVPRFLESVYTPDVSNSGFVPLNDYMTVNNELIRM